MIYAGMMMNFPLELRTIQDSLNKFYRNISNTKILLHLSDN
jgi:hypothetical protein